MASGARLKFEIGSDNTKTFVASVISGAGTVEFASGTGDFGDTDGSLPIVEISGGTLSGNGELTAQGLNLSGGTLTGTGTLTVNGTASWTGGTIV